MSRLLLYSSECWRVTKKVMARLSSFHNGCLRRLCKIFWSNTISNENLYALTGSTNITLEIRMRPMRWLGHVLRMGNNNIPKVALKWTHQGKQHIGRPKTTWQ